MQTPQTQSLVTAIPQGPEAVAEVLAAGVAADERDHRGYTALMLACERGDADTARILLEAGASPNRRTFDREETVLHLIAGKPEALELVQLLLQQRVRLERRDRFGWTPLMVAAHAGALRNTTTLLEAGADASAATPKGRTALALAEAAGHAEVVSALSGG